MSQAQARPNPESADSQAVLSKSYKWYMLLLLWGAFFLNQGDRQLFNNVLPLIEKDMGFTTVQLGLVATIFTIFYGLFVPIAGYVGDAIQKRLVVFFSLLVFSAGTLATGWVPHSETLTTWLGGSAYSWLSAATASLVLLIVLRSIATGIGEAFYYPAANSLISIYHSRTRATAMAVHQTANYTGVVFGGTLAAWIGYKYGWRVAFYSFGSIGVVWAFLIYFLFRNDVADFRRLRNLETSSASGAKASTVVKVPVGKALRAIFSRPTFYLLSFAFGGMCFVNVGYLTWTPKYLMNNFGVSGPTASFNATFYHHLLAYVSVFVAAGLSDYLSRKVLNIRMRMEFIGLLCGAPFIWLMGASDNLTVVYLALAGFGLFRGVYDSNLFAAMFDVVEPQYRATASGVMLSFAFVIGSASPIVLAKMAEGAEGGFGPGLSALAWAYVASAALVLIAILFFYKRDRAAAEKEA